VTRSTIRVIRSTGGVRALCEGVQTQVCRLALGMELSVAASAVAGHVRECAPCDAFVDELGRVKQWLRTVPTPVEHMSSEGDRVGMAARALVRELLARFARDLLEMGRLASGTARSDRLRPRDQRRQDARRLSETCRQPESPIELPPRIRRAVVLALGRGEADADEYLECAMRLDPLGLDVVLAYLGCLERAGRSVLAHRITDRMLVSLT